MAKNILVLFMCITLITVSSLYPHTYLSPPGTKGFIKKQLQMSDIESLIRNCNKENVKEIEDEILRLINEGEIILGLYGIFTLALKDYNQAFILMRKVKYAIKIKSVISKKEDDLLTLYLKKVEEQLKSIPDSFKNVIVQLCENYRPSDVVKLINSFVDLFYVDPISSPSTAPILNEAPIPLLTFIIDTLLQDEKYLKHVVAIVASLTENKKVNPLFAVDGLQNIFNISLMVEFFLYQQRHAKRINIRQGHPGIRYAILIEKSH